MPTTQPMLLPKVLLRDSSQTLPSLLVAKVFSLSPTKSVVLWAKGLMPSSKIYNRLDGTTAYAKVFDAMALANLLRPQVGKARLPSMAKNYSTKHSTRYLWATLHSIPIARTMCSTLTTSSTQPSLQGLSRSLWGLPVVSHREKSTAMSTRLLHKPSKTYTLSTTPIPR